MGRRKIEIKAIRDDRNRSVTFLKRKGGLFKKAHELSVLCSVDVAVIIFGHNKKLYEFSSGDIRETLGRYQYWGPPHEHKGPNDFIGKGGADDDDDDDISVSEDMPSQPQSMVPPHIQNQHGYQHMNHTSSASPPIPNGVAFDPRHGTPQPQVGSRPSSRNHLQRVGSISSQTHPHGTPTPPQNGFAYVPGPPMYNHNPNPNVNQQGPRPPQYAQYAHPPPGPQQQPHPHPGQAIAQQHHHQQQPPQQAPHHLAHQPPSQPQHQHHPQQYMQDQARQSMPPTFPSEQPPPPAPPAQQQQQQQQQQPAQYRQPSREPRQVPQLSVQTNSEDSPSPPARKPSNSKSRSIFTPIDDQGSLLARFGGGPPLRESPQQENVHPESTLPATKSVNGPAATNAPPQPTRSATAPQRIRVPAMNPTPPPPVRSNSAQANAKRPRLKVQIPSEQSDGGGSATADSSPRDSTAVTATPARTKSDPTHTGVVLPPPSPSAGALLSAGAQGPPNPFARPPPPGAGSQNGSYGSNNLDTPISALPSRFVSDALLPSPSSFFPEWGFGRSGPDTNMLPSPLTFPTPSAQNGPGFGREEEPDKKRKSLEAANGPESVGKKVKT